MGYARAAEMIELAGFETALDDHLRHNLFPSPIGWHGPNEATRISTEAVEACASGDWETLIDNGQGLLASAETIVSTYCLDAFVNALMDQPDDDDEPM